MTIRTALISVSNRDGVVELGQSLSVMGVKILSTGGTEQTLRGAGIAVTPISKYTRFPEILDGRVKTLHAQIYAGILARRDDPGHRQVLEEHQIDPIDLVVVNLYPFVKTVEKDGTSLEEAIEQIDIGGPTLIRASAKNFRYITVVVDPSDYPEVVAEMRVHGGAVAESTRWRLARKAFQHTSGYDAAISSYLERISVDEPGPPPVIALSLIQQQTLRYGENPHQRAALYRWQFSSPSGLVAARQLQGKELSFNNYIDLDAGWDLCMEFDGPFCAIIKHTNPCGAALGKSPADAYDKAFACDPLSAFGSVIGFNREVDKETAEKMAPLFVEAVIAPAYSSQALQVLSAKKNLRVIHMNAKCSRELDFKKISGGFLVQEKDQYFVREHNLQVVTQRRPEKDEIRDLLFAWAVCKHVKSNAIVYAWQGQTVGVGAGQMSRVDSVRIAAQKARLPLSGCVMASDAFFPFRDGLDEAARVGIRAVIQPGGSIRDEEVIRAADEHGIAMVFTGVRHFKH